MICSAFWSLAYGPKFVGGRESLPAQTARILPGTQNQASTVAHPTRLTLVWLSRWFDWRNALVIVRPKTFIGWHRKVFQLFWRWKCQSGRPRIPLDLQRLIRQMAYDNPSWGEERIANELLLKLGLRVSPRTIRKYLPKLPAAPAVTLAAISAGQLFSRITPTPLSPVTSASSRPPLFEFFTCLW